MIRMMLSYQAEDFGPILTVRAISDKTLAELAVLGPEQHLRMELRKMVEALLEEIYGGK